MKPTLTQVLGKAQELINSGKYQQIRGNFTDYCCGRCYIALLAEAASECGLNVPELGLVLRRTGWLTSLGIKDLLYSECEWLNEYGTPFYKLWGKNDDESWTYQQIQDWLVFKNEAAKRKAAKKQLTVAWSTG
jgi:hypothetical protein